MTRIVALAMMIGAFCCTSASQQVAEFSSYYSGNRYDFRLTHKQLLSTPAWLDDDFWLQSSGWRPPARDMAPCVPSWFL